jgi:O-antigen/teichoic acid export membrane protein
MSRPELKQMPTDGKSPALAIRGSLLAKNTVLNFTGMALPLVIGVVTIPLVIHGLGEDRFGILSLAWVVFGYFSFFDLGLGRATTKFVAEALGKGELRTIPKLFWTTVIFQAGLGVLGAIMLALLTPLLAGHILNIPSMLIGETKITFYILALSLPIVLVSASFRGLLEAGQRFDLVNMVKAPSSVTNYIMPLIGMAVGFRLPGIMFLLVFVRLATLLAWLVLSLKTFPVLKKTEVSLHRETITPLLSFGGWITVSNLASPILVYADRFFIGTFLNLKSVGYYSAPYEVIMRMGIIPGSLLITLFPTFSSLDGMSDQKRSGLFFGRSVKYILISVGAVVIPTFLFSKYFIGVWLGPEFVQKSTLVFQILAAGFLINSLAGVPMGFLQGIGRADITAKFHLVELIVCIPLTWILVKKWGINGAAAAWAIRVTLDMILLFWAAWKVGQIRFSFLVANRIPQSVFSLFIFAGMGSLLLLMKMSMKWGIVAFLFVSMSFGLFVWNYSFDGEERAWAKNRLSLLVRKRPLV